MPPLLALCAAVLSQVRHEREVALAQEAAVAASDTVLRTLSHRVLDESGRVVASALNDVLKQLHGHERIIFALAGAGTMLIMMLVGRLLLSQRRHRANTKALAASAQQLLAHPAQRQNSQRRGLGALGRAGWRDDRSSQICARTRAHRIGR